MANAVAIRSQYTDLFGTSMLPVLEEIFASEVERHPMRRDQLARKTSSTRDIWQATEIHDLEKFAEIPENSEYTFSRTKQGANKTLTMAKYGRGFSISEEAVEDGKFDHIGDMVKKLAKSAKETQEIAFMNLFNNGFTSETTNDGVSIFNTAHPLPSGGSYRNKLSVDADLSDSSLRTALSDFETQFVGDTGIIMNIKPKILLVHPDNKRLALELTKSELRPQTADNNMNAVKEDGLMVVSSPHLTDTDAWFLLADTSDHYLWVVERQGIRTKAAGPDVGYTTDSIFYKASYREAIGATQGYGAFGTTGA